MFSRPKSDEERERPELKITLLNDAGSSAQDKTTPDLDPQVPKHRKAKFDGIYDEDSPKAVKPRKSPGTKPRKSQGSKKSQPDFAAKRARAERPMTESRIRNISEFQLSQRDYTAGMMRSMLERRAFAWLRSLDESDRAEQEATFRNNVEKRIQELVDAGLIDDARYARLKARSMRASGKGARKIQMELTKKGIHEHMIQDAITEVDAENISLEDEDTSAIESERAAAETLAQKKRIGPYRVKPTPSDHAGKTKLWRREAGVLSRAGYGLDIIREILDREPEENTDW